MAFKPIDPKRDEYRRYLERGGIIESLTKVFVRILKERPEDPTQYLLHNLGDARLQADNIAYLQNELEDARIEIQRLTEIIKSINPDLLNEIQNKNESPGEDSSQIGLSKIQVQQDFTQVHESEDARTGTILMECDKIENATNDIE
ncbi:c-Myc-binding protein homolog [Stomoxys calcitrans]|uniref:c-Myc-binding protein n=1 Tax=Stomoxys calcitrans TaxID=35570 RepID=A0A1I8P799_STOCA|nr:c-Myc-binding protein homolog [Stomoxys calcitrans]